MTFNWNVWFVNSNSSICSGGSRLSDKGAARHPDPEIRAGGGGVPGLKRKIFQHFEPQFGPKIRGAWPPWIHHWSVTVFASTI